MEMSDFNRKSRGLSPVFVIVLTVFIDITGYGIIIPLLPYYATEFEAGPAALGVLIASFALMQSLPLNLKTQEDKAKFFTILMSYLQNIENSISRLSLPIESNQGGNI